MLPLPQQKLKMGALTFTEILQELFSLPQVTIDSYGHFWSNCNAVSQLCFPGIPTQCPGLSVFSEARGNKGV